MAPRRRPRKRSNTRMDAAIDAMKPFGFPNHVVVKTIKELLKVYGEEGWPFIEEVSYKVLLEAILEKDNGEGTSDSKKPVAETSSSGTTLEPACSDVNPVNPALQTSNGSKKPAAETSSGSTFEPACSDVNPVNTALQTSNGLDNASEANEALCTSKLTNESEGKHLPSVEAEGSIRRHVQYPCSTSHSTPPRSHNSPPLPGSNSTAKRRPYYGWICSDDEEDLVELRPGPLAEEIENWLSSFREHRKRWDVKPEDM